MGDGRISDEKVERMLASVAPTTLPMQAFGPEPIEWLEPVEPVWVWVSWPHHVAERTAGVALGRNDRVVNVRIPCAGGSWEPWVWRNAVARREA